MTLRDVDITVKKGQFVCVIGDVGCGKSSLLSAINGNMVYLPRIEPNLDQKSLNSLMLEPITEAPIKISGSVAYVEQQPWI